MPFTLAADLERIARGPYHQKREKAGHEYPCRECEGTGHYLQPRPGFFDPYYVHETREPCQVCHGDKVVRWDAESALAAGLLTDRELAIVRLVEEGHYIEDARDIADHYLAGNGAKR